ncbi:hypothetical protein KIPB_011372, partial [Kipferlia bialata]
EWKFNHPHGYGHFYIDVKKTIDPRDALDSEDAAMIHRRKQEDIQRHFVGKARSFSATQDDSAWRDKQTVIVPEKIETMTSKYFLQYRGEWEGGLRHGYGCYWYSEDRAEYYEGLWANDLRHGFGIHHFRPSAPTAADIHNRSLEIERHQAETEHRLEQGKTRSEAGRTAARFGYIQFSIGCVYRGQWEADMQRGDGVLLYPNGNMYVGEFGDGLKSGLGEMFFVSQRRKLVGCWVEGNSKAGEIKAFEDGDEERVLALWAEPSSPWQGLQPASVLKRVQDMMGLQTHEEQEREKEREREAAINGFMGNIQTPKGRGPRGTTSGIVVGRPSMSTLPDRVGMGGSGAEGVETGGEEEPLAAALPFLQPEE